ncbi:undecaprenyldiphospho-muramoylpentapeptide beta-N-acetylglucosaminyltransferase [Fulvivirga sediminis]|uniref:UDP-N-acetylglucosamine--N-acetylmuramyl-(pentapeptide) pyrophosphoryl-undecaprenol N-acetylglucosamine transferase n=1 Tax=Fulvivirga sediminis TaxID=2803949 RepID=A0A937K0R2_9BACT|nr:undecaprenyldiphospho-muramoylpentapeptide beta-N-acetylglucosaminyltransferase [Fulvivirga sediminis]MBL3656560.1 undecaprenyldiphospho-muramoylpentapeptide beta-N-acetylglucosaminyltransferase [Fulvivirga sediminis]
MSKNRPYRFIISGGGTGGHIYPAIAVANEIKHRYADAEILFVGAEGKMEMTKVPEAGYEIKGLWISGLQRRLTIDNLLFPVKLISSYMKAQKLVKQFKPDAVIGFGGYASGPTMLAATAKGIPAMVQEQNSHAGITNKRLGDKAKKVCVAYDKMEKYFPEEKIVFTGNPVRRDILKVNEKRDEALKHFNFSSSKKTILVLGGSLGARTINNSIIDQLQKVLDADVQLIWQTGKFYYTEMKGKAERFDLTDIRVMEFIKEMDLAYAAADLILSRAGALSISELCLVGKPVVLIPSPNVAEDHQTKNAMALVQIDAAIMIKDSEAKEKLIPEALKLLNDKERQTALGANIKNMGRPNAANDIVNELISILN